ncbi:MAG: hypothetical protein U0271_07440 [Polyangiaceae bacterium]
MRARRPSIGVLTLTLGLTVSGAFGCSGGTLSQGPSDTLRAYAQALEDKRVDDAYRLLSDDARRSISLEAFRRMVLENPDDVMEVARALARPATDPTVAATVTLPNGEELKMVYENGRWRIDAAALDLYGQATPRQALTGFLRAFERKRYDVVLRYVPDDVREGVGAPEPATPTADASGTPPPAGSGTPTTPPATGTSPADVIAQPGGELTAERLRDEWEGRQKAEMTRIVQAIKAALPTATIEEMGDVASMSYGADGTVSFIREHGAWKIRDF